MIGKLSGKSIAITGATGAIATAAANPVLTGLATFNPDLRLQDT